MAESIVTLTSPFGSTVKVPADRVDQLVAAGYTKAKKTAAKKTESE